MKKALVTFGALLVFGMLSPVVDALQSLIINAVTSGNSDSSTAMNAGLISGIITFIYWGIAFFIIRELHIEIDRKKRQKEVEEKEARYREERRLAEEASKNNTEI